MESEIETQVSLKETILRVELWVLTAIMGNQFKVVPKRSKYETLGKGHCLEWQQNNIFFFLRDKKKYSVKDPFLFFLILQIWAFIF